MKNIEQVKFTLGDVRLSYTGDCVSFEQGKCSVNIGIDDFYELVDALKLIQDVEEGEGR